MKYLLDTHVLIWHFEGKLSNLVNDIFHSRDNFFHISSASLWEIAIKGSLNKLDVNFNKLLAHIQKSEFSLLQVEADYLIKLYDLPFIHRDPFDRLLIATAQSTEMTLITSDENIQKYDVVWVW